MEVCNQSVDASKLVSWINKNLRPAAGCFYMSVRICHRFERAGTCRTYGYDAVSAVFCAVDLIGLFLCNLIIFRMHMMIGHLIHFHRPKRPKPHVKRYLRDLYAFVLNLL